MQAKNLYTKRGISLSTKERQRMTEALLYAIVFAVLVEAAKVVVKRIWPKRHQGHHNREEGKAE
jgi:hypothetical protein